VARTGARSVVTIRNSSGSTVEKTAARRRIAVKTTERRNSTEMAIVAMARIAEEKTSSR